MRLLFACALTLVALDTQGSGTPVFPLEKFQEAPEFTEPKVSPDGTRVAILYDKDGIQYLEQIDLATMQSTPLAQLAHKATLTNYWWKGDNLLLLHVENADLSSEFRTVDLVKRKEVFLTRLNRIEDRFFHPNHVTDALPEDPDNVLLSVAAVDGYDLCRMSLRTRKLTVVEKNPGYIVRWILNDRRQAVAALGVRDKKQFVLWRPSPKAAWQQRELGLAKHPDLLPLFVHTDQRRLVAIDYTPPGPASVVAIDLATMKKETLFRSTEVDPDYFKDWGESSERPRQVGYETDRPRWFSLDEKAKELQEGIDAALPETCNQIVSASNDEMVLVVLAYSDREPGTYYLLNRRKKQLRPLEKEFPDRSADLFCSSRYLRFKNRSGLLLHGRTTLPANSAGQPPLVVVTGPDFAGPRSRFRFDPFAQLFVTRGYAYLQVDYRGTAGYGRAFLEAGDFQIASAMPDDVEDAVRSLAAQGLVDGSRVALFGEVEGGLVAIQMLDRYPHFAAWVNWNTPAYPSSIDFADLSMSPRDESKVFSDLGGEVAAIRYRNSLVSRQLVEQIRIPSFHYYSRNYYDSSLVQNGNVMERYLSDAKSPAEFVTEKRHLDQEESNKEMAEVYRALFAFLDKNLMRRPGNGN